MIAADLTTALPEIVLALFAMAALMVGVYGSKDQMATPILWATAGLMVLLALYSGASALEERTAFNGMYLADGFAHFAKMLILLSAAVVLVMGQPSMAAQGLLKFEYPILIALSVVLAFAGQMGDIAESAIKRHNSIKDSSDLIPGHGGVLDRFDALIAVAALALLMQLVGLTGAVGTP